MAALDGEERETLTRSIREKPRGGTIAVMSPRSPAMLAILAAALATLGCGSEDAKPDANPAKVPQVLPHPPERGTAGVEWITSRPAGVQFTKSEITVDQYRACVQAGRCAVPHPNPDPECNYNKDDRGVHPMNCIQRAQAEAVCEWLGGRLPTKNEWNAEASNNGTRRYPWGQQKVTCDYAIWDESRKKPGCGRLSTSRVCSRPKGNSVSGLCDMSGNVWEWMGDRFFDNQALDKQMGKLRGGSWRDALPDLLSPSSSIWDYSLLWHDCSGVRCARSLQGMQANDLSGTVPVSPIPPFGSPDISEQDRTAESESDDAGAREQPYVPPPDTRALTREEEDFIIAEFSRWVRKKDAAYNPQEVPIGQRKVNVRRWKTADPSDDITTSWGPTIEIWGDGDEGYTPGRSFARYHRTELEQDFDKDGTTELVFSVDETYGGTDAWNIFYSLERLARGGYQLHRLEIPCSCPRKAWCPASPMNALKGVSGHLIALEQCCWNYLLFRTGECCDEVLFSYKKGTLKRKSFEAHACADLARSLAGAKPGANESP